MNILENIKQRGGYVTYDEWDELSKNIFKPELVIAGWGDKATFEHNQSVAYAQKFVSDGKLINTGTGYRINGKCGESDG